MSKKLTSQEFIDRVTKKYNGFYDYDKINYKGMFEKIEVICPIHGSFLVTPNNHLHNSSGCRKCKGISSTEEFAELGTKIHNGKYGYLKTKYLTNDSPVIITCSIHGDFEQRPTNHIYCKSGCPKCANEIAKVTTRKWNNFQNNLGPDTLIEKANSVHNGKYDYSLSVYTTVHDKICIICPKHGEFWQSPSNHINLEAGCPKCSNHISKGQIKVYNFITQINSSAILEDRETYNQYFVDISIPNKNLIVEYNGLFWHSLNQGARELFHLNDKRLKLKALGLRVINIYEDEWINSQLQIKQILKNALGVITNKIFARKCSIWKTSYTTVEFQTHIVPFFEQYHHQGLRHSPESVAYCLVYDNQIVACALFGSNRYHNQNECELIRYATIPDTKISGGLSKLISHFHKDFPQFEFIVSFCDNRFFTGDIYEKIGFNKISDGEVGFNVIIKDGTKFIRKYRSYITKTRLSRFFSEDDLKKYTQKELAMQLGWLIVPDCGQSKYILTF